MNEHNVRTIEDAEAEIRSLWVNVGDLQRRLRDNENRFSTLQTPWWKRIWFWIDGWPWYNLNGTQSHRPWHRGR